jgi:hypothetical protein
MLLNNSERLADYVITTDDSDVFHIQKTYSIKPDWEANTMCAVGISEGVKISDFNEIHAKEAQEDDLRLCEKCKSWIERIERINYECCDTCGHTNLISEEIFHTVILEKNTEIKDDTICICASCVDEIETQT